MPTNAGRSGPSSFLFFALVALSLSASACSSGQAGTASSTGRPPTSSGTTTGSGLSPLGQECSAAFPCGGGLTCYDNIPNGYCSQACTSDAECPSGGSCVTPFPGQQICANTCNGAIHCNREGFSCDANCEVCVPEFAQYELVGLVSCPGHVLGGGGALPDGGACGTLPTSGGSATWSAQVEVSANAATFAEAEGSLAGGTAALVAAYMVIPGDAGAVPPENWIGLATSTNNGNSFSSQSPIVSAADAFSSDPTLAVDSTGTFYLVYGGYDPSNGGIPHLWVATAAGGTTFSAPQDVLTAADIPDGGGGIDKPVVAIDPVTQQPLIVFSEFGGLFGGPGRIKITAAQAGSATFQSSVNLDDGTRTAFRDLPSVAFDQTGMLYVAWVEALDGQSITEDQILGNQLAGNTNNGIYFTTASFKDGGAIVPQLVNHLASGDGGESILVDSARVAVTPDGTQTFVAYVVADAAGAGTEIELAVSHDQGFTWPVHTVVDDQPGCATHFHPAIFVDSKERLWASWVDNRDGNGNVYCALSTNNGASFGASQLVSSAPFYFTTYISQANGGYFPAWLGGYQQLSGSATELYALWSGAVSGSSVDSPAHVYFAKAPLP